MIKMLTLLTKVVFGKNSDRPEGEVQEVVEVGCFLQLVYFVFVCFGIGLFIITQYVRSRPQTILLVLVSRFFNTFGKYICLLSKVFPMSLVKMFLSSVHLHRSGPGMFSKKPELKEEKLLVEA